MATLPDNQPPTATTSAKPIRAIGGYDLLRHLGNGGMGSVYLARHKAMDRLCAIKLLPQDLVDQTSFIERFQSEAQILGRLDHPHIVRVYNFGKADGECFLEMEYLEAGDLEGKIRESRKAGGEIPIDEIYTTIESLLTAIGFAHEHNIVHRDLKPGNILLHRDGRIKVSDFGLATVVGEDFHRSLIEKSITLSQVADAKTIAADGSAHGSNIAGTVLYMSPQTLSGEQATKQDDLYSVGVITYYLLTGFTPTINYSPPSKVRKGISKRWDKFVSTCLKQRREDRYQTAEQALKDLRKIRQKKGMGLRVALATAAMMLLAVAVGLVVPETRKPLQENIGEPLREQVHIWMQRLSEPTETPTQEQQSPASTESPAEVPAREPVPVPEVVEAPLAEEIVAPAALESPEQTLPTVVQTPPEPVVEEPLPSEPVIAEQVTIELPLGSEIAFRWIPPGTVRMGSPASELGRRTDESRRFVDISEGFYLGRTEITQEQYVAIMGDHPSRNRFGGQSLPVEQVLFRDLVERGGFLDRFNQYLEEKNFPYRASLPTEAQWEYACRAGTTTSLYTGHDLRSLQQDPNLSRIAVYSSFRTQPVGLLTPNSYGLYDMLGNVWEWTSEGVLRGGSYVDPASLCRAAVRLRGQRGSSSPDPRFGFRLALEPIDR